jgi:hypothetical protein
MKYIKNKNLMSFPSNEFCLPNVEPPNVFRPAADDRLPNDAFFIFIFFLKLLINKNNHLNC